MREKRVGVLLLSILLLGLLSGCASDIGRTVRPGEIAPNSWDVFVSASLRDGSVVTFSDTGARCRWLDQDGRRLLCIEGVTVSGLYRVIPVEAVVEARVRTEGSANAGGGLAFALYATSILAVLFGLWHVR